MHLILVPGRGDSVAVYQAAAIFWRARGFMPHVHNFGWCDGERADFTERMCRFLVTLNTLNAPDEPVYAIGTSAGGTVVLNALLARPELFTRVALVAAPVARNAHDKNALLDQSLKNLNRLLHSSCPSDFAEAHAFVGDADQLVSLQDAMLPGMAISSLGGGSHSVVIAKALTTHSGVIARWLVNGTVSNS